MYHDGRYMKDFAEQNKIAWSVNDFLLADPYGKLLALATFPDRWMPYAKVDTAMHDYVLDHEQFMVILQIYKPLADNVICNGWVYVECSGVHLIDLIEEKGFPERFYSDPPSKCF